MGADKRYDREMDVLVARKAWRISSIIFPLVYYFTDKITALLFILPFLCIFFTIEILRHFIFRFNESLFIVFRYILKDKERKNLLAATWFLLAVSLSVVLFKKDIAVTAILFLIFGDTASAIVGSKFGRIRIGRCSLEGSLAYLLACLIIALMINFTQIYLSWPVLVMGALAASASELLPWLDDNFTVALFSGIIMTIVSGL